MLKPVILLCTVILAGCASQPTQTYHTPNMKNFVANCNSAPSQIDYLSKEINAYNEHFKNRPTTLEDRRAYGRMKNALWSLRSTCSAKYL
jgi:outer membrane murein-binding lipoprotein Lpp